MKFSKIFLLSAGLLFAASAFLQAQTASSSDKPAVDPMSEWAVLEKEYQALRADRDNILAQVKSAYDERNRALDEMKAINEKLRLLTLEKDDMAKKLETADREKTQLNEKVDSVDLDISELRSKVEALENLNKTLTEENRELLDRPLTPAQSVSQTPKSMMQVVGQHDQLQRENADLHYNLGVLMSKNKDYKNAVAEFTRAVQLRPDDSASHFNLGKIYAEYFKEKEKAISHFQEYLRLEPDAGDRAWVEGVLAMMRSYRADERISE